jgi:RimJ/RimL family protein N-acetyltransferase
VRGRLFVMIEIDLRPFGRPDFARLIGWITSPEFLLQWAGPIFTYPLNEAQLLTYILGSEGPNSTKRIFKAVDVNKDRVVGHIELNNIDPLNRSASICRVLVGDPFLRGRGVGTQMMKKVLEIGFDQLKLHRIDLVVFDFNNVAIRCYERLGFVKEGHLREIRRIGEEYWSLYQMSILEDEWKASKSKTR